MTTKEIIDALLKLLELIISWPTLFLLVGVVFYKDVKEAMPSLLKRIRKAPVIALHPQSMPHRDNR